MKKSLLCLSLIGLISPQAFATEIKTHSKGEVCEISNPMDIGGGEEYTKSDKKAVVDLCSYDVHSDPSQDVKNEKKAVAVCPKMKSTYPAVQFVKISKKSTREEVEAQCAGKIGEGTSGTLAKFKYSMSCANTASIVGYYHVSRALGIKFVPPVVLRSMDRKFHLSVAARGKKIVGSDSQLISQNWRKLYTMINNGDSDITSPDGNYTVGALSENPRGEQKTYDGVWLGGSGQGERLANFKSKSASTYQLLKQRKSVKSFVGTEFNSENYTAIQQMKDVSDMIILDSIFGQKDRFGNTHSIYTWLVVDAKGKLEKLTIDDVEDMIAEDVDKGVPGSESLMASFEKAKDMKKDWKKEIVPRRAAIRKVVEGYLSKLGFKHAFAENLLLKDNDCGLMDSNPFVKGQVIEGVYHVSPETYEQLMKMYQKVIVDQSMDQFLSENLDMSSGDMSDFKSALKYVAENLKAKDDAGDLYKDLEVKKHLQPKPPELTADGLQVFEITNGGYNVRKSIAGNGKEPSQMDQTEVIQYQGGDLESNRFSKVAVISRLAIGKYAFVKVRVIEGETLQGEVVYIATKAIE